MAHPIVFGGATPPPASYQIANSVRARATGSTFLSQTRAAGNTVTWTLSTWVKLCITSANNLTLLSATSDANTWSQVYIQNDKLGMNLMVGGTYVFAHASIPMYRDPSGWYHVVVVFDAAQAVQSDRVKYYVNGSQVSAYSDLVTNNLTQNYQGIINSAVTQKILVNYVGAYDDGYLADYHFVDAQALSPSDFGKFDANGVWVPIKYTGTYGANGCKLEFKNAAISGGTSTISYAGGFGGWTVINQVRPLPNGKWINQIGVNQNSAENGKYVYILRDNGDGTYTAVYQSSAFNHPGSGLFQVGVNYTVPSSGTYVMAVYCPGAALQWGHDTGSGAAPYRYLTSLASVGQSFAYATAGASGTTEMPPALTYAADGLGTDTSDNGNHWTVNGFTAADQMVDTPSNNYCVLNALDNAQGTVLSNGNLGYSIATGSMMNAFGSMAVSSGVWCWEVSVDNQYSAIGIVDAAISHAAVPQSSSGTVCWQPETGYKYVDGTGSASYGTFTGSHVIGVILDLDANTLTFYDNGASKGSISITNRTYVPALGRTSPGATGIINFGQRPFAYTYGPAKALCTANLPAVAIPQPGKQFDVKLWTGDNVEGRSIGGLGFRPDFVWSKSRSNAFDHRLGDSVRGGGVYLASNTTYTEALSQSGCVTAFNADGFSVGTSSYGGDIAGINESGGSYVGWCWKGGGAAVTNTAGSVASQVSANPAAGFSIVRFPHTSGVASNFGHGLGAKPAFVILKNRQTTNHWHIRHEKLTSQSHLLQFTTSGEINYNSDWLVPTWATCALDSGFSSGDYIAYCFAEIPSYSRFGGYTGNGNADGPFVYCGFCPQWVMVKRTDAALNDWLLWDLSRQPSNPNSSNLYADTSGAENSDRAFDLLSNGFKVRDGSGYQTNGNGSTYIYAAFAEHPFGGANVAPSPAR